jgi:hypothetical protein
MTAQFSVLVATTDSNGNMRTVMIRGTLGEVSILVYDTVFVNVVTNISEKPAVYLNEDSRFL